MISPSRLFNDKVKNKSSTTKSKSIPKLNIAKIIKLYEKDPKFIEINPEKDSNQLKEIIEDKDKMITILKKRINHLILNKNESSERGSKNKNHRVSIDDINDNSKNSD